MDHPGLLIAIEGTDWAQEGTQFGLLRDQLVNDGYDVETFIFPHIDKPSGHFVKEYLSGSYGPPEVIGPYSGAILFALDRYQFAQDIKQSLAEGKVVLTRGFVGSNMAHQGSLFKHPEERRGFFIWLDNLEFQMMGIPRPDKNLVLRSPTTADSPGLVEVYDDLCQLFPKDFTRIDCSRGNQLLDDKTIHKLVRETVEPLLPARSVAPKTTTKVSNETKLLKFRYFTPPGLNRATQKFYAQKMDGLANTYSQMSQKLTEHFGDADKAARALRRVLPLAAIQESTGQPLGAKFVNNQTENTLAAVAQKHLTSHLAPLSKSVDLVGVQPRNELDLIPDILYQQSNLSMRDIEAEIDNWSYEQKATILEAYQSETPSDASVLEKITYSWDLLTSFETLVEFVALQAGRGLDWQQLTPRYGYKMPSIIEDADLSDLFEQCFDTSLELYSDLQTAGYAGEAQYATLAGHRVRWGVSISAREIKALQKVELRSAGVRKLVAVITERISEVHPILFSKA